MLPPEIEQVLQQVQAHANYMPDWQMEVCYPVAAVLT
jgi:aarF domain-containing kinase